MTCQCWQEWIISVINSNTIYCSIIFANCSERTKLITLKKLNVKTSSWQLKPNSCQMDQHKTDCLTPDSARPHHSLICISCYQSHHRQNLLCFFCIAWRCTHSQVWQTLVAIMSRYYLVCCKIMNYIIACQYVEKSEKHCTTPQYSEANPRLVCPSHIHTNSVDTEQAVLWNWPYMGSCRLKIHVSECKSNSVSPPYHSWSHGHYTICCVSMC
jgi:hypothetical protein